jgi:hypothetical protein
MPKTYVDGVEAMDLSTFKYAPKTLDKKDSKDEKTLVGKDSVSISPVILAEYHVNPANADLSYLKEGTSEGLSFVIQPNAKKIETKAEASKDFNAVPVFKSFKDGVLTVEVKVTGTAATEDLLSVIALNVKKADGEFVVSDYATLYTTDMDELRIADPNAAAKAKFGKDTDEHYRRTVNNAINAADGEAYLKDKEVWSEGETALATAETYCDTTVKFNSKLDLNGVVAAHTFPAVTGKDRELTAADQGPRSRVQVRGRQELQDRSGDFRHPDGRVRYPRGRHLHSARLHPDR